MSKTYYRDKLNEGLEGGVRGLYQDNGYFRALVAPNGPIIENLDTRNNRLAVPLVLGKSNGKAVNITIPIEEGNRYMMATLKIVSADPDKQLSLKVDALISFFPLKQVNV